MTAPHNLRRPCAAAHLVSPRTPRLSLTRLVSHLRGVFHVNLSQAIQDLFNDIRDVAQIIAPIAAVIGFLGLGVMYLGSSWPIVGDWKKDNPKASNQVVIGLFFIVFASSVTALISFT